LKVSTLMGILYIALNDSKNGNLLISEQNGEVHCVNFGIENETLNIEKKQWTTEGRNE